MYRPIYTMHKWLARQPGCLFCAITLYSLLDEDTDHDELQTLCVDLARVTGDEVSLRMLGAGVTLEELGAD